MCCSTSNTPRSPRWVSAVIAASISATTDGWMPSVGSSRISTRGEVISARAIASCWRWPPDSSPARRVSSSFSAGNRSSCSSISALRVLAAVGDHLQVLGGGQLAERLLTLRNVRQAARDPLPRAQLGDVFPVEHHLARTAFQQPDRGPQQRGLAGAVVAHHRGHPVRRHLDAHPVDHFGAAVAGTYLDELQHYEVSSTSSSGFPGRSGRGGAEVDLLHLRIGLHLGDGALGDHLAAASTVTEVANARMKSMSCSTTTTVRSAPMRRNRFAGLLAFLRAHPGHRLVEQQHVGVLHQQHADLQPLLLPVRQHAGRAGRPGRSGRWCPAPPRSPGSTPTRRRSSVHAGRPAPAAMSRFCSTVSSRRRWPSGTSGPTPEPGDLVHLLAEQFHARLARPTRSPATSPVIASITVVLPAPLGPIRNRRSPWNSVRSTSLTALNPSKPTCRPRTSR